MDGAMSDLLTVYGDVSLDGGTLNVLLGSIQEGGRWLILSNEGQNAIDGTFTNLSEGALFYSPDNGVLGLRITYGGGDGNDIELTAVPEPGTLTLLAMALASAGGYIRRRRRAAA